MGRNWKRVEGRGKRERGEEGKREIVKNRVEGESEKENSGRQN